MCKIRIVNEWAYGITAALFPYIKHKASLKILKHAHIAKYYIVATILRNCSPWFKYSNVTSYFDFDVEELFTIKEYFDERFKP